MSRLAALALAGVATAACGPVDDTGDQRLLVVVTTTVLGDVTANVAGEHAVVEVLMPIGGDPHSYEASAQQAARLREADLIVANGVGLEEGLLDVVAEAESDGVAVLRVGDLLDPQPFAGAAGRVEAGHGEGLDPHVWMDPLRMVTAAALIGDELTDSLGDDVLDRVAAYQGRLRALSDEIGAAIESIPSERRVLVTNHLALGYYAERYGLEILGTVIPAATTGAETSAAQFSELVELIERERVPAIFGSTTESAALAEAVAGEVGFPVEVVKLYTGSLGEAGSGAATYIEMMRTNTELIVAALSG